jgi:hypothetical protein
MPRVITTIEEALEACIYKEQAVLDYYYFRSEVQAEQAGKVFKDSSTTHTLLCGRARELDYFNHDYGYPMYAAAHYRA